MRGTRTIFRTLSSPQGQSRLRALAACLLIALCARTTLAQTPAKPPALELTIPASEKPVANLVRIVAPAARCMVVSDIGNVLVVGHSNSPDKRDTKLSVYKLDAQGNPPPAAPPKLAIPEVPAVAAVAATDKTPAVSAKPAIPAVPAVPVQPGQHTIVTITQPASLAAYPIYVQSLAAHPTLPLIYVWIETSGPDLGKPETNLVFKELDRLLIYAVKDGTLQLVKSACRGPQYSYSSIAGSIALDTKSNRIYLPNLRDPQAAIGFVEIDKAGMVVEVGEPRQAKLVMDDVSTLSNLPTGLGYVPGSDDAVIWGGPYGPVTWDISNRRARQCSYMVPNNAAYTFRISGHPTRPVVYFSAIGAESIYRLDHADGYVSGIAQRVVSAFTTYQSAPVVMAKRNQVAVGGTNRIHAFDIDAKGWFTGTACQTDVLNPAVNSLAYSEKFDRLYVVVNDLPPPPPSPPEEVKKP